MLDVDLRNLRLFNSGRPNMKSHDATLKTDLTAVWATVMALRQLTANRDKGVLLVETFTHKPELVKYFRLAFDREINAPARIMEFSCKEREELAVVVGPMQSGSWPQWNLPVALLDKALVRAGTHGIAAPKEYQEPPPLPFPKDPVATYKGKTIGTVIIRVEFIGEPDNAAPYSRAVLLDGDMRVADIFWIKGTGMKRVLCALESVGVEVK